MRTSKIGLRAAKFYVGLAECELSRGARPVNEIPLPLHDIAFHSGSLEAAKNTIATGISLNAQPSEMLVEYLERLRLQVPSGSRTAKEVSTPALSAEKVTRATPETDEKLAKLSMSFHGLVFNDKENVPPRLLTRDSGDTEKEKPPDVMTPRDTERTRNLVLPPTVQGALNSELTPRDEIRHAAVSVSCKQTPSSQQDDQTVVRLSGSGNRQAGSELPPSTGPQSRLRRMERKRLGGKAEIGRSPADSPNHNKAVRAAEATCSP